MQEFTDYAVLEIPVVVHVFHYYSAGRLTAESIAAQIDVRLASHGWRAGLTMTPPVHPI